MRPSRGKEVVESHHSANRQNCPPPLPLGHLNEKFPELYFELAELSYLIHIFKQIEIETFNNNAGMLNILKGLSQLRFQEGTPQYILVDNMFEKIEMVK
ncbi:unnamed protein product [Meloidogyne enterolobii]|uniref:Uncharacterized protein n=2 Tax=Meloidogyne enterolobii TaxID=390850 RepID=A0ACB0YQ95_MELEN